MNIQQITGQRILNSAGNWALQVTLQLSDGSRFVASVPEGVSCGMHEAIYVPIGLALQNIKILNQQISGRAAEDQSSFDAELMERAGERKHVLGANTTLALSIAYARALAYVQQKELFVYLQEQFDLPRVHAVPRLMTLAFEGAKHGGAPIAIQEILMVERDIEEARVHYQQLADVLKAHGYMVARGAEGGYSPERLTAATAIKLLEQLDRRIALDVAAQDSETAVAEFMDLAQSHTFFSVEDPFKPQDLSRWQEFVSRNPNTLVVADDLTVTDPHLIVDAASASAATAVIIKPNQIGTITEAMHAVRAARAAQWQIVTSHRGHETNDDFIADFAVAIGSDFVKFGGFWGGERVAKYNRLLAIKEMLDHA